MLTNVLTAPILSTLVNHSFTANRLTNGGLACLSQLCLRLSDLLTLTLCFDSFLTAFNLLLERVNTLLLWRQWPYRFDSGDFFDEHRLSIFAQEC